MKKFLLFILSLFFVINAFSQTTWFVEEYGDDINGDGTFDNAYATITYALSQASAGDFIYVTGTITGDGITDDGIVIDKDITILGERFFYSTVQAADLPNTSDRKVFTINAGVTANFYFLKIRNGNSTSEGGGIYVNGNINMEECVVEDNSTTQTGGGLSLSQNSTVNINKTIIRDNNSTISGGGIFAWESNLSIDNSAIYQNNSGTYGGGLYIYNSLNDIENNIQNTTIYDNNSTLSGAGIYIGNSGGTITTYIQNVTIASNTSNLTSGNGLVIQSDVSNTLYIQNCIISNGLTNNFEQTGTGTITLFRAYTICRDNSMPGGGSFGNLNSTDPMLLTFGNYGGLTPVCPLASASPAIDYGNSSGTPAKDQRGAFREGNTDIGSYELRTSLSGGYIIDNSIATTYPTGSSFISFDEAVNALNFGGITSEIYFYVTPDQTFTEPPLYVYGTNFNFPVTFMSNIPVGKAEPVIKGTAGVWDMGIPSSIGDAVFYLVNPTDINFYKLNIQDNNTNTTTAEKMEFGIAMIGDINDNSIDSCRISLDTDYYNTFGIILYSRGVNTYNTISYNNVSDCNMGVGVINENETSGDSNIIIGNDLVNIGVNSLVFPSGGVMLINQSQVFVENNFINNLEGNIIFGIMAEGGSPYIYNNTISNLDAEIVMAIRISSYANDDIEIYGNNLNNLTSNQFCLAIASELDSINGMLYISNNEINTISAPQIIGIMTNQTCELDSNLLSDFDADSYLMGIAISDTSDLYNIVSNNVITDFNGTGESYTNGINISSTSFNEVYNNKISNLYSNDPLSIVMGINSYSDSTNIFYNNVIYDLQTPFFNSTSGLGLAAISLNGGSNELYYNTMYLDYVSQAANNASCLLLLNSGMDSLKMKNNIFVNNVDITTGLWAIGIINLTADVSYFSELSNNNLYFMGLDGGSTKQVMYNDGANILQSLSDYTIYLQSEVSVNIENLSVTENPPFISNTTPYDLHITSGVETLIQNGGVRITNPSITTDLDGKLRFGETGYTGGGTAPDLGAFEMYEPYIVTVSANDISSNSVVLNGIVYPNLFDLTNIEFEYGTTSGIYNFTISGNPNIASGENEVLVNANLNGLEINTTYFYRIIASLGLTDYYGEEIEFTTLDVNINENRLSKIDIFPNPSTGLFTINSENSIDKIVISDLSGKTLFDEKINSKTHQIDLNNYNSGIYLIEIHSAGEIEHDKIIKK
jgi:hypothetical protein